MNGKALSETGLSALELLIAVFITSACLAASWPHLGDILSAGRLRREAERIAAALGRTRLRALQEGKAVRCDISPGAYACEPEFPAKTQSTLNATPSTISFYPNGVASPSRVTMTLDGSYCILLTSLRGRTTLDCPGS